MYEIYLYTERLNYFHEVSNFFRNIPFVKVSETTGNAGDNLIKIRSFDTLPKIAIKGDLRERTNGHNFN